MEAVHQQSSCQVEDDADDDVGEETKGGLDGGEMLDFLEAGTCQWQLHDCEQDLQKTEYGFSAVEHSP